MRVVYKYQVGTDVLIPEGAKLRAVKEQHGHIYLWAEVETDSPIEVRHFRVVGTGHPITQEFLEYRGTAFMPTGLVWHVYEVMK